MTPPKRDLTDSEAFVLAEIQSYWGPQNTVDQVFFTDRDEAVIIVVARDGSRPVMTVLTNLGRWYEEGVSLEELREHIKGPDFV